MSSLQDILLILLALEFLIITACVVLVSYFLVRTLQTITRTAESVSKLRSIISIPALIITLISKIIRRGR